MLWTDFNRFGSFIDPWRPFERVNREASGYAPQTAVELPAVNVWAEGDKAVMTAELPGIDPQTVDISVAGKTVTLRASRKPDECGDGETYHRRERWNGQFNRTIDFPYAIDAAKVEAHFDRGVLRLTLPRAEETKPKKIMIKTE